MRTMSKISLLAVLALTTAGLSQSAFADRGRHYESYDRAGAHFSNRHVNNRHYNKHRRHYDRRFDRRYDRRYDRRSKYAHRHYRSKHHDRAAYLIGGLALGSIITHAITRNHDRSTSRINHSGRSFLRDINGDCFERSTNRYGDQVLVARPSSDCAW